MDLNLLPNVARFQLEKMKFSKLIVRIVISIVAFFVVVMSLIMIFYWFSRIKYSNAKKNHDRLEAEYTLMSDGVNVNQNLRYKLKLASGILDQRFEYGEMFRKIDSLFEDEIKILNMKMTSNNEYNFSGQVTGGEMMDLVEKKVVDINAGTIDGFGKASINSVSREGEVWSFKLDIQMI